MDEDLKLKLIEELYNRVIRYVSNDYDEMLVKIAIREVVGDFYGTDSN